MLTNFFRTNLPYGMKRNLKDEWMFFNREFMPLGWNSMQRHDSIYADDAFADLPIYTKYKGLTETKLLKLAIEPNAIRRDDNGKINIAFFYNDNTNPLYKPEYWDYYFKKT